MALAVAGRSLRRAGPGIAVSVAVPAFAAPRASPGGAWGPPVGRTPLPCPVQFRAGKKARAAVGPCERNVGDSATTRGTFVGRQAELDLVCAALDAARASSPQIVLIEGEAGIGKTAFVRRFLATSQDVVVLEASGDETEATLDYGVVSQLVARAAHVSSWEPVNGGIGGGSAASAFSVGGELLGMLGALQDPAPVVAVVDDAHWMDPASAGAVLFALRRLYADRVLVLIVSRPDGLDRLGPSWSKLLHDSDRVQRVSLSGLAGSEVGLLASSLGFGQLSVAAAERLREHTGGHPLYVKALLSELSPDALAVGDGPLPAPHSFAATVIARASEVATETQDLVAAAAVAGTRCELALAGCVAEIGDLGGALEQALGAELLTLVPGRLRQEVTFPHPLVRAAVYDDLAPAQRADLHLAWAKVTSGTASLAHRVAASQGGDDALATELSSAADDEIAGDHLTAAIERLLWASRVAGSVSTRETALLRAFEILVLAGDRPGANSLRDAILACSDSPRRSFAIATLIALEGKMPEAEAALQEVIVRPDFSLHPELLGPVASRLAIVCAFLAHGADAIAWAQRSLDAKDSPPIVELTGRQALSLGLLIAGRGSEGIAQLQSLSPSRIEPEPYEPELLTSRGNMKAWWGDLPGAVEDLSAVIRWSRSGVRLHSLPNAYGALAEAEYRLGRWDDGLKHADVAISLSEDNDRLWDLPFVHAAASYINAGRGNWSVATEHADAAQRGAEVAPLPTCIYYACVAAANLAWVRGDWGSLLMALAPLRDSPAAAVAGLGQRVPSLLAAEALIWVGRVDAAARALDRVDVAIEGLPDDVTRVESLRLRGVVEQVSQRPAEARAAFAAGKEAARTVGSSFCDALLELSNGHFLRKAGSRGAAIAALREARERFERLGARPFTERCDDELAACGVRPAHDGSDDDYGLTAREQVVARLVASGKSNREVAGELYLSTKAIEYHLGNIFGKVGIRSRHQLASRLPGSVLDARPPGRDSAAEPAVRH